MNYVLGLKKYSNFGSLKQFLNTQKDKIAQPVFQQSQ